MQRWTKRRWWSVIEQLDWAICLERNDRPDTLFCMDPPDWETEGYGVPFECDQYELMARKLRQLKGKAIISLNDHPDIRRRASGWRAWPSTTPVAVRTEPSRAERQDLIIYQSDREAEPAGLSWPWCEVWAIKHRSLNRGGT